jgi:hypothetical protein
MAQSTSHHYSAVITITESSKQHYDVFMSKKSFSIILLTSAVATFFSVQVLNKQQQINETASESKHKYIIPIYPSASDYSFEDSRGMTARITEAQSLTMTKHWN